MIFFMLNQSSTWFQLSSEVCNVSVAQNPKLFVFCRFLTLNNSEFQFLRYSNVIYLKRKMIICKIQIHYTKAVCHAKNWKKNPLKNCFLAEIRATECLQCKCLISENLWKETKNLTSPEVARGFILNHQ